MSMRLRRIAFLLFCAACGQASASTSQFTVETPSGTLAGTMQAPADSHAKTPWVLIIPGSGPTDRDGNNPMGVRAAPYRLLAEGLAAQGVASVRIDKRGMFGSAHPGLDANKVTLDDYADDIEAWVQHLRKTTGTPCVWVLGHSEGALVAEKAATRSKGICGVILVAGMGRPMADVLLDQLERNPANEPLLAQATAAVDSLRRGNPVDVANFPAPLQRLFNPAVQGFEMSIFPVDPVALLKTTKVPVLVIQGTADLQIGVDDAKQLASARSDATLKLIDGMNHVLKKPDAGAAANMASYGDPNLPLADDLVLAIVDFVRRQ